MRETDRVLSNRKGLLLDCSVGAKETRSEEDQSTQRYVRQARLDRRCVRRAAEQPAARQTRLATDRQRTHERRAAEQPEASLVGKARKTG